MNQISFYKRTRLSPYYFNHIILFFLSFFLMSKTIFLTLNLDLINTCFSKKIGIRMKCFYILIILFFHFM